LEENSLEIIKKNSGIDLTEGTNSFDIASTQDILSRLIDEKYNNSLMYSVCEVFPLDSTWGSFFTTFRNPDTTNFEILRKDIYTQNIKIPTGFTREAWQDIIRMFKDDSSKKAASILRGISDDQENFYLIDYLRNNSISKSILAINSTNTGWITSQISMKVAECVIEMNSKSFKTLDSFCILPAKWAEAFLGTASFVLDNKDNNSTYFVGRYGRTDFYINPISPNRNQFNNDFSNDYENSNSSNDKDYCYVGLKSKEIGYSSLIFAPYQYEIQDIINPDSGDFSMFLYNRFGLVENPQSDLSSSKKLLYRFEIQ